jgi:hypothetical protein
MNRLTLVALALLVFFTHHLSAQAIFSGSAVELSLTDFNGAIQWQRSVDSDTWRNVPNGTTPSYVVYPTADTYYRAVVTEENCASVTSAPQFVDVYEGVTPAPNAVLLSEESLNSIRSVTPDNQVISFSRQTDQLDSLSTDDILIIGVSPATPYGLLVRIVSIDRSGTGVVLTVVPAALTEAFEQLSVNVEREITPADVVSVELEEGVELIDNSNRRVALGEESFGIRYEKMIGDFTAFGELRVRPTIDFAVDIDFFTIESLSFTASLAHTAQVGVRAEAAAMADTDFDLARFILQTIPVGPLLLTPIITLEANLDGTVSINVETSVTQDATYSLGGAYANGSWAPVGPTANVQHTFSFPTPGGNVAVDASVGPELELLIYGVLGVEVESIQAFLRAEATVQLPQDCNLSLNAGLRGVLNIEPTIFGVELPEYTAPIQFIRSRSLLSEDCREDGLITGSVRDAATGNPLDGVLVLAIASSGSQVAQSTTTAGGTFQLSVPEGDYSLRYSRAGYLPEVQFGVSVVPPDPTVVQSVLQVDDAFAGPGDIVGIVRNAQDGSGIGGAVLEVRRGVGATAGQIVASATTSASGQYVLTGLDAGSYTVTAAAPGFLTGISTFTVLGGQTSTAPDASLTPVLNQGEIRIVLDWGPEPSDLDSHLTGPAADDGRFHVYYANRQPAGANAFLDLDDVSSFGPETITITNRRPGLYRYSVHDFTNRNSSFSSALAQSGARVRVFVGDDQGGSEQIATLNVPGQPGTLWTVFEVEVDQTGNLSFNTVNNLSYENSPSAVGRRAAPPVATDAYLIANLPAK